MFSSFRLIVAISFAASLLAGCLQQPAEAPPGTQAPSQTKAEPKEQKPVAAPTPQSRRGGTLSEASAADMVSFHVYKTTDTGSSGAQSLVYAGGLTTRDPRTLEIVPDMARSWTISDDKLTYTFTLRDDLKWSDGEPLTADDFAWTFQQANNPDNKFPYRENFADIVSYTAPDPHTIAVTVREPLVVALEMVDAVTPLPRHIWEKLDWNDTEKNPEIMSPSVASGPYKLKEWKKDDHQTFVANDLYYKGRPNIDTLTVRIVPSQAVAYQMLKSGEVDYAGFTPADYKEAKTLPNVNVYEWWPAAASWSYIGFNMRRPALQDPNVRYALSYAVDRQAIVDNVTYGLSRPTYGPFVQSSWVYNPDVPKYDFNPAKARDLLAQAGYTPGRDGILTRDGQPLSLKLLYGPNSSKVREQIATIVQQEFKDVGVDVSVQGLEWGAFLNAIKTEPYDWDMTVLGWRSTIEPHWMYQIWSESTIPDVNSGAYVNKKVEQLFEQGAREFDVQKRKKIYQDIQTLITQDEPYIFLTADMSYLGVNKRVAGIEPTALGIGYNLEQWYIKE
ncbi:MAG: ABC transporter substrate-binding protein [Chloroflexi bacterium]|nr:ABC transporter substrate-binding protein [Chloroflexota bacterium]